MKMLLKIAAIPLAALLVFGLYRLQYPENQRAATAFSAMPQALASTQQQLPKQVPAMQQVYQPIKLDLPPDNVRDRWQWAKIPDFKMPSGTVWVMNWGLHSYDDVSEAAAHGFTHLMVENVERFPKLDRSKWKFYTMMYQNSVLSRAPHFGNNGDTKTKIQDLQNSIDDFMGRRTDWMGGKGWCDIMDIDVEMGGNDARFLELATQTLAYAKSRWGVRKTIWFATSPYSLFEARRPSSRFEAFKQVADYHMGTPYVYLDHQENYGGNVETGIRKTNRWIFDEIHWLERNQPYMGREAFLSWWYDRYANYENEASPQYLVRPDIAESYPIWYLVLGGARNGGGMVLWKACREKCYHGVEDHFVAGMYRASRANRIFEDPSAVYNQKLEFSLDEGRTWQTDERTLNDLTTDARPYVRAVKTSDRIAVAAFSPLLYEGSQQILIRDGNWVRRLTLRPYQSFFGSDTR